MIIYCFKLDDEISARKQLIKPIKQIYKIEGQIAY